MKLLSLGGFATCPLLAFSRKSGELEMSRAYCFPRGGMKLPNTMGFVLYGWLRWCFRPFRIEGFLLGHRVSFQIRLGRR